MCHSQDDFPNVEWRPLPNGTWERDIDEVEIFYKRLAKGNACHPVTATASFICLEAEVYEAAKRVEAALRKAWIVLRWKHPTLGSRIEHDHDAGRWKRVYTRFTGLHELESWVRLTYKIVDACGSANEWFNENWTPPKFATLLLVRSDEGAAPGGTVFLQCPHDITDGIGALQLMDQLFEQAALAYEQGASYALPEWGGEIVRLSPCLRTAAAILPALSEEQTARFEEIQTRNAAIYSHPHLLSLPPGSISSQGKTQRRLVSVPRDTTENILRYCKLIGPGVSVTHVLVAALAASLAELQPRKEEQYHVRYVNHSMINLRPFCRMPYRGRDHAAAAYHTVSAQALGLDLTVPGSNDGKEGNDLRSLATSVREFYESVRPALSSGEQHEQVLCAPSVFKTLTPPLGVDPHAVSDPPFCPVSLSSLGKVETIVAKPHGPFALTSVSAFSDPVGPGVALFLGSWDGKMDLSGVFSSRYHDPAFIDEFLQRIISSVYRGLDIIDSH